MTWAAADAETHALLARIGTADAGPYEQAMLSCLSSAHQALDRCGPGPLLDKLVRELTQLARHCQRDADYLSSEAEREPLQAEGLKAELQMARRIAHAANTLSELARFRALYRD